MGVDLLRDGILKAPDAPAAEGPVQEAPTPFPPQPCHLCTDRVATARCVQCEKPACPQHHWTMFGLCHRCLTPEEMAQSQAARQPRRPDLGIKWVED